ncbi:CgeB family protein [Mucilaginibacter sp. X4EP1]|jgi:spore maturation protein CgeB|uniref:CgeB family protein n=1 Tax=Mucilaginibacter sp. X4EP1 TaxID=2723092 RepID=UPI0021683924|nr:glycosyltransferase [Mucilaginibacter sp. X4EP1]MCS3815437.1 hypothetical protein [Mucilaginibacter sp. X4EP1]
MKILFVANLKNPSASGRQRLWALQQSNATIIAFDKGKYPSKLGRFSGPAAKIFKQSSLMRNDKLLGKDLIALGKQTNPDVIWIEWATELRPSVLNELRALTSHPLLISFQDDNPWGKRRGDRWMWRNYFKVVPFFDLHLVKRESDIANLKGLGGKNFRMWKHGVYSPLFHPLAEPVKKKHPVSFVGTCIDGRVQLIEYLLTNNVDIHVFGNRWDQRSNLPKRYPANFHPSAEGEVYADVIHQSQICLGLVSHSNQDEWTMRTYEVPGSAGLLLAERTPVHEALFEEDKEMAFFSTAEECLKKIENLLADPEHCLNMGRQAYQKCKNSHFTLEEEMQHLLNEIETKYYPLKVN